MTATIGIVFLAGCAAKISEKEEINTTTPEPTSTIVVAPPEATDDFFTTTEPIVTIALEPILTEIPSQPTQTPERVEEPKPTMEITPDAEAWETSEYFTVERDSLGSEEYKEFIGNPEALVEAWTVPESIYNQWYMLQNLQSIEYAPDDMLPRWSPPERTSNTRLNTPEIIERLGRDNTAIILDSGGQHSIGMAYELAQQGGWQPIPMLPEIPCSHCNYAAGNQLTSVYLYAAEEMRQITENLSPTAPPAFIWNAHRSSPSIGDEVDNSYEHSVDNMPSPEFLARQGITNILFISEGRNTEIGEWEDPNFGFDVDWASILKNYKDAGLQVYDLGIPPN